MSTAILSKGVERNTLCISPHQGKDESDYDYVSTALSLAGKIIYAFGETVLDSCGFRVYISKRIYIKVSVVLLGQCSKNEKISIFPMLA